ncbi:MAG: hypothetical protein Q8L37_07230 [Candidatus Gottesmanbacteria bacterium]|nr:hypothetical protein [Candidatus Gottesmanbacteria bacterium]
MHDIVDTLCLRCYLFLRLGGRDMVSDYPEIDPKKIVQHRFRYFEKKDTNEK